MRDTGSRLLLPTVVAWLATAAPAWPQVTVEYIAHAAFVLESSDGTRIAIDPYNGDRWLGYGFPSGVKADAVLVTHPHYDHDAAYYFPPQVPVLRQPGRYAVGGVRLHGVRGKHADPYAKDFDQRNTVWVVEADGLRLVHLGDNGPLTADTVREIGRVDVLFVPVDGQYHILQRGEIDALLRAVDPAVVVPMHFRLPQLSSLPESLGPVAPWLAGRANVTELATNRLLLSSDRLEPKGRVVVFSPSPDVTPWPTSLHDAFAASERARTLGDRRPDEALEAAARAHELAPRVPQFAWELGERLARLDRRDEAIRVLERGLVGAARADVEYVMRARLLLARLYAGAGRTEEAVGLYAIVARDTVRPAQRAEAEAALRRLSPER